MSASPEFYLPVKHGETIKANLVDNPQRAVRLYCTNANTSWSLQVRGKLKRADGQEGKDFIVASASLDHEGLLALRTAIDKQLAAYRTDEKIQKWVCSNCLRFYFGTADHGRFTTPCPSGGHDFHPTTPEPIA